MSQTPSSSDGCNDQNDAPFHCSKPFRMNENHPAILLIRGQIRI